jgi:hypothetical protein
VYALHGFADMVLLMMMGIALMFLRANEPDREFRESESVMILGLVLIPLHLLRAKITGIAGTIAVFSCMVAWEFILIQSVPQIPYQTRLDMFMVRGLCTCSCSMCSIRCPPQ